MISGVLQARQEYPGKLIAATAPGKSLRAGAGAARANLMEEQDLSNGRCGNSDAWEMLP
jgi:hypothetical protein